MKTLKFAKILILFCFLSICEVIFANRSNYEIGGFRSRKTYSSQAKKLANNHEWVSFKYRYIHDYDNDIIDDLIISISIKYDESNSLVFIGVGNDNYYILTNDTYKNLNHQRRNILDIRKNKADKRDVYENIGLYGSVSNIMYHISYYLNQIDFAYVLPVRLYMSECEPVSMGNVLYNRYIAEQYDEVIECFVNKGTNTLDSVCSVFKRDGHTSNEYYKMYDFDFGNKQQYIDSIFYFKDNRYAEYTMYNELTLPSMSDSKRIGGTLDFPLITILGDTTTLRNMDGWILLNFWTISCKPCMEKLYEYKIENDSLGYRVVENNGITIMAIEHKSDNMEYIKKVADRFDCCDIVYSAKGIGTAISIPCMGYYYLLSPSKEIIFETGDLGDYSELLKAKTDYESSNKK